MTTTPYGGEDQPTRLQALAQEAPHMDNREVARLERRYTAFNRGHHAAPPVYVDPADCWCGHRIEVHDHTGVNVREACALCGCEQFVEHTAVAATRNTLDADDELDGERRRDNTQAAIELEQRRARRTA